ncbi:MAG TPA: SPFH domain-containing protein, partial [Spirochaetota bacterium]|nr:SPFH domain-containing protein [Spirochaetota bacterium]
MGVFNFIKGQFIDVIEWVDDSANTMVWKFPDSDKEIKNGAQLTVRESQVAVFLNEGNIGDVFQPGRHTLTTQNIPILTSLKSWKYGLNSPFKADVYFINTKQFLDQKWGTTNPIMMRD